MVIVLTVTSCISTKTLRLVLLREKLSDFSRLETSLKIQNFFTRLFLLINSAIMTNLLVEYFLYSPKRWSFLHLNLG